MTPDWKKYEQQIFEEFSTKYPESLLKYDQNIVGRFSKVPRQVDILINASIANTELLGIFDCKMFNKKIDVKVIDSMIGFMDDLNANFGGVITTVGFTKAAINRAKEGKIDLRVIEFESPKQVVEQFQPSLDFSDPRNSMYLPLIF